MFALGGSKESDAGRGGGEKRGYAACCGGCDSVGCRAAAARRAAPFKQALVVLVEGGQCCFLHVQRYLLRRLVREYIMVTVNTSDNTP